MVSPVDQFSELERRILHAIEVIKATRAEKEVVENELALAKAQIERLERERDVVRTKVESLLETLAEITEGSLV